MSEMTYTYQGGHRLALSRSNTHFVSRASRNDLRSDRFRPLQPLSPHSVSVQTSERNIDQDICRARQLGPAYAAYTVADTGRAFLVTDRIFVRFRHPCDDNEATRFALRHSLQFLRRLTPRDFLYQVPPTVDVVDMVRTLSELGTGEVELVEHDLNLRPVQSGVMDRDPLARDQWYLHTKPQNHLVRRRALVDCEGAWDLAGFGDPDVVIGVIDCGCDMFDPNFDEGKFVDWAVLVDGELQESSAVGSDRWDVMSPHRVHGTLCASLAAASINDFGGVGVAPDCKLLPVKWQDLGSTETFPHSLFADVITFLRNKVDVVTSSWNLGPDSSWPVAIQDILKDAAINGGRNGNGIVWIWSAGNQNSPIHHSGQTEVPIEVTIERGTVMVTETAKTFTNSFANLPGVLHVGAVSSFGRRSHYSNYGYGLDLVAPSDNFHLYRRMEVSGAEMKVPLYERVIGFGGTSAAAPIVAGVAALVRSANPDLTSLEIKSILQTTADRKFDMRPYPRCSRSTDPDPNWDVSPIPPFDQGAFKDGWSPWFGFGKVNARKAVKAALKTKRHVGGLQKLARLGKSTTR
jgi:hypothetical protein